MKNIRNFSIIAHIDHGKSTLADRFIQLCGGLSERSMTAQVLDSMALERERGITIKAQSVSLNYQYDQEQYQLNIIDTPGHVDFSYEVERSLAACEGALLIVDASQGVEAQSVANCHVAVEQGLEVIPVLNKIDLATADPERVKHEIEDIIGISAENICAVSAKTGQGVKALLDYIVAEIPPPQGSRDDPLQALIIDSWFDKYVGVVALVRVVNGILTKGDKILLMFTGETSQAEVVGIFTPQRKNTEKLQAGQVGFVIAGVKNIHAVRVGDTLTHVRTSANNPLPGFRVVKPKVFAGIFPTSSSDYKLLVEALDKLSLNDSSLSYSYESSQALGFGFRCGFLGMLHMEIVQERLEREYGLELITTAPTVIYKVFTAKGEMKEVYNPANLNEAEGVSGIQEPFIHATILVPKDYVGNVLGLCVSKRGIQKKLYYIDKQVSIEFELPLNEVVFDFFDQLNSVTKGYASFDYKLIDYRPAELVKLDVLINGDRVDALSIIVHKQKAQALGRQFVDKIHEIIPRQMFDVAVQAAIGTRIIARTTVKALRKNVTAKCYGGDITRKRKLLEKQKAGKKRMKQIGKIEVPQEVFLATLKIQK